jgi:sulfur-oxidizing protein SoxB
MAGWLRQHKEVAAAPLNLPSVKGMGGNPGMAA